MKQPSPPYQIGDVVPVPEDASMPLANALMAKRGMITRHAAGKKSNQFSNAAKKIVAGLTENERRRTDPFEQARTFLRHKGFVPVCKIEAQHVVGRHRFRTEGEVMDFARAKGWGG